MTRDESAGLRRILKDRPEWQRRLQRAARESATIAAVCRGYQIAGRRLEHCQGIDDPDREAKLQDLLLLQTMVERLIHAWSPLPSTSRGPQRQVARRGFWDPQAGKTGLGNKIAARTLHPA